MTNDGIAGSEAALAAVAARMREIAARFEPRRPAAADAAAFRAALATLPDGSDAANGLLFAGSSAVTDRSSSAVERAIVVAARERHLDPNLLRAVVRVESGGNPLAVSPVGAQGLMQLMPGTARELGVTDPFDPVQNVRGGAAYLRSLLDRFGDVRLALAAYNAGPGAVASAGGIPPFAETQQYVRRVTEIAAALGP